ncbi:MAG: phage terminase large subunit family protein [Gammaproteobacteria bacterium]|nr:phage terminase large subunit family protein [Gammaproteobacteria bacterium]
MQSADGNATYCRSWAAGLLPDPPLWVDEWADQHMVIPAETGAAEPGRYRIERTPYARAVMRALSPEHPARRVVVKGASQLLKTQVGLNWFCALIAGAPSNMIWLQPTDKLAKRVSARFDKTVAAVQPVRRKLAMKRSRDSRNTLDTKEFHGGTLWILTGRSASNLSEATVRYTYADEVDRILRELQGEGDPLDLLEKRQGTFGRKAKSYYTSSPTEADASRIDELFRQGDQNRLYVPCPLCGEYQTLEWEHIHADFAERRAWYVCAASGCIIEEHHKPTMLERLEWRPQSTGDGETVSFELSYLYAPLGWDSWWKLAQEYHIAEEAQRAGDSEKMQVFVNTRLARCWAPTVTRISAKDLRARAETYPLGRAPQGPLVFTAACDVQGNRLEALVCGWAPGPTGMECWVVARSVIFCDPTLPESWAQLDDVLTARIEHAGGVSSVVSAAFIDSGDGDSTAEVYEFCRPRKLRYLGGRTQRVMPIKGASAHWKPILAGRPTRVEYTYRGKPAAGSAELWFSGTDTAKDWIYNRLALPGQTAIHFSDELPDDFFEQLVAEVKVTEWKRGRKTKVYKQVKRGQPNEGLDLLVYNLTAAHYLGLPNWPAERWARVRAELSQVDLMMAEPDSAIDGPADPPADDTPVRRGATRRRAGNYATGWRM